MSGFKIYTHISVYCVNNFHIFIKLFSNEGFSNEDESEIPWVRSIFQHGVVKNRDSSDLVSGEMLVVVRVILTKFTPAKK